MSKSTNVVLFPKHKFSRCDCHESGCPTCDGGLVHCETCGGAEGSLPECCPQQRMTDEQEAAVYAGDIDFRRDGWTTWTRSRELAMKGLVT